MKPSTNRIALWVWYRGDGFRGFQAQPGLPTVQAALTAALAKLGTFGAVLPAGRTDRGVHARMQVVGVKAPAEWSPERLSDALGPLLPDGLGIASARLASRRFHPQWTALGKEYRYRLWLGGAPCGEWRSFCWAPSSHERIGTAEVDPHRLAALLETCVGERDFFAFHAASSIRKHRVLERAELVHLGGRLWEARLVGQGFGRFQARILVGSAVLVAAGRLAEADFRGGLEHATPFDGLRAPGEGLTLWEVRYPEEIDPFALERARPSVADFPDAPPFVSRLGEAPAASAATR